MRRTNKHKKKADLDWVDSFFSYINGRNSKKKSRTDNLNKSKRTNAFNAETSKDDTALPAEDNRYGFDSGSYKIENDLKEAETAREQDSVSESVSYKESSVLYAQKEEPENPVSEELPVSESTAEEVSDITEVIPHVTEEGPAKAEADRTENAENKTVEKPSKKKKKTPEVQVVNSEADFIPLWEKNPGKYRKKRPFFVRLLGGIWSFIFFWILTGGILGVLALGTGVTLLYSFSDPELDAQLANLELDATTQILAYNSKGELVVYEELHSTENRVWVSINEMPKHLLDITVAIEDKRFYQHMGFDPIRTVSATLQYAIHKLSGGAGVGDGGGGSTITQQLIKNVTQEKDASGWDGIVRKFKEILRAFYLERIYDKEQILEYYLNTIHFGNGCDGIYTAAKYYFDKEVSELTMTESAALISITNEPAYYEPYRNEENNKKRRIDALWNAWDQGYISEAEYNAAKAAPLELRDRSAPSTTSNSSIRSYFTDLVFEWTVNELMTQKGYDRSYAINYLYTAGLRIYTTVDPDVQAIMEEYFANELNYIDKDAEIKAEVAMEVIDPSTGNILGVIGGRGVKTANLTLNRVTQTTRPPGSAIKPIAIYGYAIENNIVTAATAIDDSPLYIEETEYKVPEDEYELKGITYSSYTSWPVNYDRKYNGILDVKKALYNSYNTPAVKILQMIGVEESYNFAKNMMGLESLVEADKNLAPLSVGSLTYGVTLQELTAAYTVFANQGSYSTPRCVTRIETFDGKVVLENDVDRTIVFTPQTAYIMTDILSKTVTGGSSAVANLKPIATAAKSGTTSNFQDRWFIGYTPYYLAGIWWGYDIPQTNENTHHVQMWHDVMYQIHAIKGITEGNFTVPDGIVTSTYCNVSGKLAGPYCSSDPRGSRIQTGLFKSGTQPTEVCDVHHQLYVCAESGQIAHENCPSAYLATFLDIARSYENMYIKIADAEYVCPPLDSYQVLYNSTLLPAYTYMIPEGEYPCLSNVSKNKYANCICQTHTPSLTPHPYTYKYTTEYLELQNPDVQLPEDLLTPKELEKIAEEEKLLEIAIQVYDQKQEIIEGITPEQYMEIVKHVYDTTETVMEGLTPEQLLELAKHVYLQKNVILDGLTPEQLFELAKYVYEEAEILVEGFTEDMFVTPEITDPTEDQGNSGLDFEDIFDIFG